MAEIKRGDFLTAGNESVTDYLVDSYRTVSRDEDNLMAEHLTVRAVNQLQKRLGFSLEIKITPSEKGYGHLDVTFIPSQPVNYGFFQGMGVFWSSIRTIDSGIRTAGNVSAEDAQAIFLAEMAGINTGELIRAEWVPGLAEIKSQLAVTPQS